MKQEELEKKIRYWEEFLGGIQVGFYIDVAEVLVKLPPKAQAIALDMLKNAEAEPQSWEFIRRFFSFTVVPIIERFIADLRSLQGDES